MHRLPPELKFLIMSHIRDECPENLPTLSLVNKEWNRIASPVLYEHIIIHLLKNDASHKLLWQPERVLGYIKRLSIIVPWYPITSPTHELEPVRRTYYELRNTLQSEELGDQSIPRLGGYSTEHTYANKIIDLIRKIPQLHDIDLLISNGGPVALHEAIREYHPSCRVSLYLTPQRGDMYEKRNYSVLSPQLQIVHVTLYEYPGRRFFRDHPDRVLEDVIFRAPNIKGLALQIMAGGQAGPKEDFNKTVVIDGRNGIQPLCANLDQLVWPLNTRMLAEKFLKWNRLVDYSCLKSWTVGCIEDTQLLHAIANLRPFRRLERLTLALFPPQEDDLSFYTATEAMFDSLPPLTHLRLLGNYKTTLLTTVLRKHGPRLLELSLNFGSQGYNPQGYNQPLHRLEAKGHGATGPLCSIEDIHFLAAHCPSLQSLCITVQRNRGIETSVYTALALFPALTTLELHLNCPPPVELNGTEPFSPVPPRDLTEFEKSHLPPRLDLDVPIWYIRDMMINSAIDEDLARTIFTHIRTRQSGHRRLAKLKIKTIYIAPAVARLSIWKASKSAVFKVLSQHWTIQTDSLARIQAVNNMRSMQLLPRPFVNRRDAQLKVIFNSIWSLEEGEKKQSDNVDNWLQSWRSWPLR